MCGYWSFECGDGLEGPCLIGSGFILGTNQCVAKFVNAAR